MNIGADQAILGSPVRPPSWFARPPAQVRRQLGPVAMDDAVPVGRGDVAHPGIESNDRIAVPAAPAPTDDQTSGEVFPTTASRW
jgi:hypothetical protein